MLPKPFLDSLEGLPGFEKNAFEQVHAQGEQITSVRLNKYKQFDLHTHSFLNHTAPVSWCAQGVYLNERPLFVLDPLWHAGAYYVQEASSMFIQYLLDHLNMDTTSMVLDLCAAPGGKSTHLLELANISLTALEINQERLARVNENITRLGLSAKLLIGDASKPELWWDKKQFDRILADTPCSATGIIRRHPDILYLRRESDFVGLKITQQQILRSLWDLLKPGGELLYVSCSIFPEEGEEQIQLFLEEHPNALRLNSLNQLLPSEWHDGFFYGKLQKLT